MAPPASVPGMPDPVPEAGELAAQARPLRRLPGLIVQTPFPLRTTLIIAAVPLLVLIGLAVTGAAAPLPSAIGACVTLLAALTLAQIWMRDLSRLLWVFHRALPGGTAMADPGPPTFPAAAYLAREAERAARAMAVHRGQLEAIIAAEQALVRRLPDPLIVLSSGRTVLRTNAAADSAFGSAIGAVLRHPGLRAAIDRALTEGRPQTAELSLPVPVPREVYATLIPLEPPLADGGRIVVLLSDRSRERAVERMRADFVANASHELRTPLSSLIGFIDTLLGPAADDPPAQTRFLGIMAEQAQRMNRLIDDLLSLSRIELTEHQVPAGLIALPALAHRLAAAFEPQSNARRMTIHVEIAPNLSKVIGDEDQLEQVLQNLLDNAVKYGREAGTIHLSLTTAPNTPPWPATPGVIMSVADDGAGIASADIPRLTERFYRADKHRSRSVGGTGLGLAIVKHIVNRHRGKLTIESTEGKGTTITIWLPASPTPPIPGPRADTAAAAKA